MDKVTEIFLRNSLITEVGDDKFLYYRNYSVIVYDQDKKVFTIIAAGNRFSNTYLKYKVSFLYPPPTEFELETAINISTEVASVGLWRVMGDYSPKIEKIIERFNKIDKKPKEIYLYEVVGGDNRRLEAIYNVPLGKIMVNIDLNFEVANIRIEYFSMNEEIILEISRFDKTVNKIIHSNTDDLLNELFEKIDSKDQLIKLIKSI